MFNLLDQTKLKNVELEDQVMLGTSDKPIAEGGWGSSGKPVLCGRFEGVNSALDFIKDNMSSPKRDQASSRNESDGEFYTFNTYEKAFDTFRFNPGNLPREKELDERLNSLESSGNQIEYGLTGDYIDMGRYMSEEPECFGTMVYGRVTKRVRIVYAFSATCYVKNKVIQTKSTGIAQLIDWLEGNGIRTEVIAVESSSVGHMEVLVKRFQDRFVYNDILVTTHPDFLRRIFFRFAEYSPSWSSGYGSSVSCAELLESYSKGEKQSPFEWVNNEHTIYLSNRDVNNNDSDAVIKNIAKAKKWLERVLPEPVLSDKEMSTFL